MRTLCFSVLGCAVALIWGGSHLAEATDANGNAVPLPSPTDMPPRDFADVLISGSPKNAEQAASIIINPVRPERLVASVWAASERGFYYAGCLTRSSADGGRTWASPIRLPVPAHHFGCPVHPSLSYSADGARLYAAYASSETTTEPIIPPSSLVVSQSLDDGATWQAPRIVLTQADSIQFTEVSTPLLPSDLVYILFDRESRGGASTFGALLFTRSLDRGQTWSTPHALAFSSFPSFGDSYGFNAAHLATGSASEVIAAWDWEEQHFEGDGSSVFQIRAATSGDFGHSFAAPVIVADDTINLSTPQVKIGAARVAHMVYARASGEVLYTHSYNRRPAFQTWAPPAALDSSGANPSLAIEPCGDASSLLHVVWMKIRGSRQSAYYTRKLASHGSPWSPGLRVANASSPVPGDFATDVAAGSGKAFAIWTDARHNPPAGAANATNVYGSRIASGVSCAP